MLKTYPRFQYILCALVEEWQVTPNLLAGLEEFTCAMYGRRQIKDVNVLRCMVIKERCGLHNGSINLNKNMDLKAYHHVDVHWYNIY